MSASITVQGFVATVPTFKVVGNNLAVSNFRLGSSTRRLNTQTGEWETTNTSWYSIACFRELAINAYASLKKGDPVILSGQLKVSEWSAGDKAGLDVEITADAIGHDLRWGKDTGFQRTPSKSRGGANDGAPEQPANDVAEVPDAFPVGSSLTALPPLQPALRSGDWGSGLTYGSAITSDAGGPTVYDRGVDPVTGEIAGGDAAEGAAALLDGLVLDIGEDGESADLDEEARTPF